jgi:RIO kinase 2
VENLAEAFLSLSREDISLLAAIERGMRTHEWVPTFLITKLSGLSAGKSEYRLQRLYERKLVVREAQHYLGYQINFDSYDLLALSELVRRDQVRGIGGEIGVGKESIVLHAQGDVPLAIKFHRQGRTSFRHVRRLRDHLVDKPRVPWLYAAALAARREFQVMTKLHPDVSIPRPVAVSRHALVMEQVPGTLLNRMALSDPEEGLRLILHEVGRALALDIVHSDLSEFNIMIAASGPVIIDWPQAVDATHPHATDLLQRDLSNVLSFFWRKYRLEMPLEEALSIVRGAEGI